METHKHPQALIMRNMIISQSGTVYSTKEVVHGRPITIPTEAHFQTVGSSLRTLTFIYIEKKKYIWSIWHCGIYISSDKNIRKRVKWDLNVAFHCYSDISIIKSGELPKKNRINIISILINLQATRLGKQSKTEQREIGVCSVFPLVVCPLAGHCVLSAPLHSRQMDSRETSLSFKTSCKPAQALRLRRYLIVFF